MVKNRFSYLDVGKMKYGGMPEKAIGFVNEVQLKNSKTWKKFVDVFGSDIDIKDKGWRGEYWGKMMRGACLTYAYTADKELYEILKTTVLELIEKQELDGRISTYNREMEFSGWDMWCRKYVMVGLEYFYRICESERLKERVLSALKAHADYIISRVGEGKIPIGKTSHIYGAVNSCSILDSFLQLYKLTREQRYLQFAEYIIKVGGTNEWNLIKIVEDNQLKLSEYPTTKAYEMMSFMEGLLTYYECTGNTYYFDIVVKFFEKIQETEQTIVGGIGYKHEFFADTTIKQTEFVEGPMLELCVTVTWIRVLSRLLALTGEVKYADRIELSAYNALYGTINFDLFDQYCYEKKCIVGGLPFDSYSPLVQYHRNDRIGGYKELSDDTHYGCCACIGAAAVALFPLGAVMTDEKGIVVNYYLKGTAETTLPSGTIVKLTVTTEYPKNGKVSIKVLTDTDEALQLRFRIPAWCKNAQVQVNEKTYIASNGYFSVENIRNGIEVILDMAMSVQEVVFNGKKAFTYGPLVLARDEYKEQRKIDFLSEEHLLRDDKTSAVKWTMLEPIGDEHIRCETQTLDSQTLIFSDYASCGKNWTSEFNNISVWNILS